MRFVIPTLPYSFDALSPVISRYTLNYHYGKHLSSYIDILNQMTMNTAYEEMPLEDIIRDSEGSLYNIACQVWNHIFYFQQFLPNQSHRPKGKLAEQIYSQYADLEELKCNLEDAALDIFGSGWVWLSSDEEGTLFITQSANAGNPLKDGLIPLLTIDVWEHAYYLDYQNRRAEYLSSIWDIIDWDVIESRYN